jgi:hypothetical protein
MYALLWFTLISQQQNRLWTIPAEQQHTKNLSMHLGGEKARSCIYSSDFPACKELRQVITLT